MATITSNAGDAPQDAPASGEGIVRLPRRSSMPSLEKVGRRPSIEDLMRDVAEYKLLMREGRPFASRSSSTSMIETGKYKEKETSTRSRFDEWLSSFRRNDPRHEIMSFFDAVAQEGVDDVDEKKEEGLELGDSQPCLPAFMLAFQRASVFSIWRPTSNDAIKMMMTGRAKGKGLDIKGKSAKRGKLSGFVPFIQIHNDERHRSAIATLPKGSRIRVFYGWRDDRDKAAAVLERVAADMTHAVAAARALLAQKDAPQSREVDDETLETAMRHMLWDMSDPEVSRIDDYSCANAFGVEMEERLFWEAYVMRGECITRPEGSQHDIGRPSSPPFQDMNFAAVRNSADNEETSGGRRVVIWQMGRPDHVLCHRDLLVAYEEDDAVMPVVSDFDCFLVGTKNVRYDSPLPPDQIEVLEWCITQIENILDEQDSDGCSADSWTKKWLDVLKKEYSRGFQVNMPKFGFGDPKSYYIMENAVGRLKGKGSVRHGAECFNYYFPQELDDHFLVIDDTLPGNLPWKYVSVGELQEILCRKVDEGFTFPLNPKWVLCDDGWKGVYDRLVASNKPNVQESLDVWYPQKKRIRERLEMISGRHPQGFRFRPTDISERRDSSQEGTSAMDLATLELKRYLALQRAKRKLRSALLWMRMAQK